MTFDLTDVTVSFGGIPALSRVNLSYTSPEILILRGPTGSGKSTILQLLWGNMFPTTGTVRVNGIATTAMRSKGLRTLRSQLGVVHQFAELVQAFTVSQNIQMVLAARGFLKAQALKQTLELLAELNVSHCRELYPHQLSGGERQLVSLARAFAMEPTVLLADEPLSMLDEETRLNVIRRIQNRVEKNMGLIVTSHRLEWMDIFPSAKVQTLHEGVLLEAT